MRYILIALSMLPFLVTPARAQISVGIGMPGIDIGINVPVYPNLVPVPGYPVYYDPRADSNYFFYDGMYWVYREDNWYASDWYNGPWRSVGPEDVPLFVLRVPVWYYRQPPAYFHGWVGDAAPRWGEHWGRGWEARRAGWDHWDRRSAPRAAPLPAYQARYSGDRYPREMDQQRSIRTENYHYQPRAAVTQRQPLHNGGPGPGANTPRPATGMQMQHGPMQRAQAQPNLQRGQQEPQQSRLSSTTRGSQPLGSRPATMAKAAQPAHETRRAPSAPQQQRSRGDQQGQKNEGHTPEHR